MKKWLSILGAIGLTAISTTSLISCQKPNNNENGGGNKPEPPYNPQKPQQPPVESKWKLVDDVWEEVKQSSNEKWYIGIYYRYDEKDNKYWVIEKFNKIKEIKTNYWDQVYRWDGNNEPQIPEIDVKNGKIIDWNE
ncbi:lipoprotein [Spiroplasma melliferum]|uniref:lipoprotein n=1 Tax=Spiroplasma melliferum TaxID=2134 RepID=UPI000C757839|nr:lipoprotein [Spiroplasma melliferum]